MMITGHEAVEHAVTVHAGLLVNLVNSSWS